MNPKKAFRKFGDACLNAPPGSELIVGLSWTEGRWWRRVVISVHTAALLLGAKDARFLADIYDKHHQSPEYHGKSTGLEWVAPELRKLADEVDQKNRDRVFPPEALQHVSMANTVKA